MRNSLFYSSSAILAVSLPLFPTVIIAQDGPLQSRSAKSHVVIPSSSVALPEDVGTALHNHLRILLPSGSRFEGKVGPQELPPVLGLFFETPASVACVYRLVTPLTPTCNPDVTTVDPSGGKGAIALVDAFDDPTALADLNTFSTQFGLPPADLTVVFASGTNPGVDPTGSAEAEESLDIEWAHAMAPKAKLFLVETASLRLADIITGVQVASKLVAAADGGEVSMSFGGGEFPQETQLDSLFTTPGVIYLASAGDSPGAEWPSTSPNVISAGGTTISRNSQTGDFLVENSWQDAGGGPSAFETRPAFQNPIAGIVGGARGTPDLSFDANPNTGVWIFDGNPLAGFSNGPAGWLVVGGTSVSAPSLAGIINAAGHLRTSSQAENAALYQEQFEGLFRDIQVGNCGINVGDFSVAGWDFCSGVGSPLTLLGK